MGVVNSQFKTDMNNHQNNCLMSTAVLLYKNALLGGSGMLDGRSDLSLPFTAAPLYPRPPSQILVAFLAVCYLFGFFFKAQNVASVVLMYVGRWLSVRQEDIGGSPFAAQDQTYSAW